LQGKCGIVLLPQFLQIAKEIFFKACWLLRWLRPDRVLCFFGTPINFFLEKIYLERATRRVASRKVNLNFR
jgi:hypothetical protein